MRVGVRVNRADALGLLAERLPHGWKPVGAQPVEKLYSVVVGDGEGRGGVRRLSLLYEDIARVARARGAEQVFDAFESSVRLHVAEMARRRVFVHAGAVGWRGRAVVVPGRSLAGKTTLVAELVRAGADYYSDEFAVLDARGRLHPFPKPLALREGDGARQQNFTVEELGGAAGVRPLPVGLVVATRYVHGARWRPRRMSAGRGVLELLDNAVAARRHPERVLAALERAVARASVLKGARGEAREAAEAILSFLDEQK